MNCSVDIQIPDRVDAHWFNTGGPHSRTRTEAIKSSLLGRQDGFIHCPMVIRLGLKFEDNSSRVSTIDQLLHEEGYLSPEDLRDKYDICLERLIAYPVRDDCYRLDVARANRSDVLRQALMLGLCTANMYDPARPVLWTDASLGRALALYDPAGFYA